MAALPWDGNPLLFCNWSKGRGKALHPSMSLGEILLPGRDRPAADQKCRNWSGRARPGEAGGSQCGGHQRPASFSRPRRQTCHFGSFSQRPWLGREREPPSVDTAGPGGEDDCPASLSVPLSGCCPALIPQGGPVEANMVELSGIVWTHGHH